MYTGNDQLAKVTAKGNRSNNFVGSKTKNHTQSIESLWAKLKRFFVRGYTYVCMYVA